MSKVCRVILSVAILTGILFSAAWGEDSRTLSGNVTFYTGMSFGNSAAMKNMTYLSDGNLENQVLFSCPKTDDLRAMSDVYYIDAVFNGDYAVLDSVSFVCTVPQVYDQNVKSVRIEYEDPNTGEMHECFPDRELSWYDYSNRKRADAVFDEPVRTERIKIYITEAYNQWNELRICELIPTGVIEEKPLHNLIHAETDINHSIKSSTDNLGISVISDGNPKSEILIDTKPSEADPCVITFDFGGKTYNVESIKTAGMYGLESGFLKADIEYKRYGLWLPLSEWQPENRSGRPLSTNGIQNDFIEIKQTAEAIRIKITDAGFTWGQWRISDVLLFGSEVDMANESDLLKKMEVSDVEDSIVVSYEYAFSPKAIIIKGDVDLSSVQIEYNTDNGFISYGDDFVTTKDADGVYSLIIIKNTEQTDKIKLNNFSVPKDELYAFYCEDFVSEINSLISEFKETGIYADYENLVQAAEGVEHTATKNKIKEIINDLSKEMKARQNIEAAYDAKTKKLKLSGYLFCSAGNMDITAVKGEKQFITTVCIGEDGKFEKEVDLSENTDYGEYTVSVTIENLPITGSFVTRAPSDENSVNKFVIDGVSAAISGDTLSIELPSYGSLEKRIAIFEISDYAELFLNGEKLESGITEADYSASNTLKVVSESGKTHVYTLNMKIKSSHETSKGGGNSSSRNSGGKGGASSGGIRSVILPVKNPGNSQKEFPSYSGEFSDVNEKHWAKEYITELSKCGIVSGYEGVFMPEEPVKREEFVKMLVASLDIKSDGNADFSDVKGSWAEPYVFAAVKAGLIRGISSESFGMGRAMTREDICLVIYRSLPEDMKLMSKPLDFGDSDKISDYAKDAVCTLYALGIIQGDENGCFNPDAAITRAEAAKIIYLRRQL